MGEKTINKNDIRETAMFLFLLGLVERPGLCQECEILKTFIDKHKYTASAPDSTISFWNTVDSKYKLPLKPLFRLEKHELPCMSFKINCLYHFNKIANYLDDSVKNYNAIKSKIDSNPDNNIDVLKSCLGNSAELRKQTWDAYSSLTDLPYCCVRLVNKWKEISKVFELPPCPFKKTKSPFNYDDTNDIYEPFRNYLVEYNSYSKIMISLLQEYLHLLHLGQKSTLILDQYGYRPEKLNDDLNWKSLESYNLQAIDLSSQLEVRLFLWPENMQHKECNRLKNTIFNALFEIPNLAEFISTDRPLKILSMRSGYFLTIYQSDATHTDEFPDLFKAYPVINLFCVEGKLLTQKILYENDGKNDLNINLKNDNSCLLLVHDDTKKRKKWLEKWKEQKKLKRYIELKKTDGENLFSTIANLIESEKSNDDSKELGSEKNIPGLTRFFDEERYKSLRYMTILLEMAIDVYFGLENNLESEPAGFKFIYNSVYEQKQRDLKDILAFKRVVEVLIHRSPKKIEFEDIPKHFLQPTMTRTGKRLATSWFVGKDGHNTRNAAVLMVLGKAVIKFIQKSIITEETCIVKEIRNIDDRLRRLEDKVLQITALDEKRSGKKNKRNISYEDRRNIPDEDLRKALLGGTKNK